MNFVSEYKLDRRSYSHLCWNVEKKIFWRTLLAVAVYLISMYALFWVAYPQMCVVMGAAFLGYHLYCHHRRNKEYRKLLDSNLGNQPHLVAVMDDSGVRIRNLNKGKHFELTFDQIAGALRSKWFVHVYNENRCAVINFDLRAMTEGSGDELVARLQERGCKVRKLRNARWLARLAQIASVLYIVLGLMFSVTFTDVSEMPNQYVPAMDVRTAASALEELGIGGITEEIIAEIEPYAWEGSNAVPALLSYVGFGEYDDETWDWSPAGNGVYAVDMEFLDVSRMYTDYLAGIEDIGGGELDFENVEEDIWLGHLGLGLGWKEVSFTLNGRDHTLRPFMTMDWLDIGFVNKIAAIVDRADTGKRLYFLYDGDTMFYVFYRNPEWAARFEAMTGYELLPKMR